jgi:hypothetical protein
MRTTLLSLAAALLLPVTACSVFGTNDELSHAAAWFECGPADGPATAIVLAHDPVELHQPSYPLVEITILREVSAIAGRTWNLKGDSAYATYIASAGSGAAAMSGTVTITHVDSANTIQGNVIAQFGSRTVAQAFTAPWLQNRVLCG